MRPVNELLRSKRDKTPWTAEEVAYLAKGIGDGTLADEHVGAFAMVAFLNGLDTTEKAALTKGLQDSGTTLEWDRPVLDKHSTGGVGDKVSLILAPIVAAHGFGVPMISGRGLGHTGGTLDKLESIPGYDATPDLGKLREVVAEAGCAIIGQTPDLAPADGRLYGIRDAVGAVESIPLITASILSKKLAAGLDGLVLDVKFGSGAFMDTYEESQELARSLVAVAQANGLRSAALLTDMDSVLGRTAGNALEVRESIDLLTEPGHADPRLKECTLALTARLLELGGVADARAKAEAALEDGSAADHFQRMVTALGGPGDLLEHPAKHLASAPVIRPVCPPREGFVSAHATRDLGLLVTALGGGRAKASDTIDPAVGLSDVAPVGAEVGPEQPLAVVHARSEEEHAAAAARLLELITVGEERPGWTAYPPAEAVVREEITQ